MPRIIPAKDVPRAPGASLPCCLEDCSANVTFSGQHQPVLVNENDAPYCESHGKKESAVYAERLAGYRTAKEAVAKAVAAKALTPKHAAAYFEQWDYESDG